MARMAQARTKAPIRNRVRELVTVRAGDLVPHPLNWRTHPAGQVAALRGVLGEIGIAGALIVRRLPSGKYQTLDGHQRADLDAQQEWPALVTDLDDAEARLFLATADPLGAMAEAAAGRVKALFAKVRTTSPDVETLLARVRAALANADGGGGRRRGGAVDPDWLPGPRATTIKTGEVWQLGAHRVLCGDSFAPDTWKTLTAGDDQGGRVQAVVTDPPYAIYGSASGVSAEVADDRMVRPFFEALGGVCARAVMPFGHVYVCCDWRSWASLWEGFRMARLVPKNCLVWDKGGQGLGSNYANTYELVGYFAALPPVKTLQSGKARGERLVRRPNLLRFPRVPGKDRHHTAAKPVAMLEELLQNGTDPKGRVADFFTGSGPTVIAAERTGRVARCVEIEPKWCDVTVQRWEKLTGKKAERLTEAR